MATPNSKKPQPVGKHHYIRTFFSSIFGFLALALIIVSILVVWLDRTLTDTNQYVKTVAPLVSKPAVQDFVVDKASDSLLGNDQAPVRDIATQLLGSAQVAGKTDEQLKTQITPLVKDSVRTVVASPAFATLWQQNNRQIHSQLIAQLTSNSSTINLDFHPLISGVIDQLGTTKLGFVKDKLKLKDDAGLVSIQGKQLTTVHKVYDYFTKAMLAIIACAILASVLCVLISVHHLKTIRRIALMTGIFCAVLALLLSATSLIKSSGQDAAQQQFVATLVNSITHDLRLSLFVIAFVCLAGVIGSKVYSLKMAHKPAQAQIKK